MWLSDTQPPGELVFDLGGIYKLNAVGLWNYNYSPRLDRGVQQFSIDYSLDSLTYSNVVASSVLTQGTGSPLTADIFNLGGIEAGFIRLNITSNYGSALYVGLSEVLFDSQSVPEPTTLLLLVLGLAGLGFARKRLN
jgi:hypothetical protein